MLEGKSQPATRQKFLVTHPLKAFDDAPNGCVLPEPPASTSQLRRRSRNKHFIESEIFKLILSLGMLF